MMKRVIHGREAAIKLRLMSCLTSGACFYKFFRFYRALLVEVVKGVNAKRRRIKVDLVIITRYLLIFGGVFVK